MDKSLLQSLSHEPARTGHSLGTKQDSKEAAFKFGISVKCTVHPNKVLPLKFRRKEINKNR